MGRAYIREGISDDIFVDFVLLLKNCIILQFVDLALVLEVDFSLLALGLWPIELELEKEKNIPWGQLLHIDLRLLRPPLKHGDATRILVTLFFELLKI